MISDNYVTGDNVYLRELQNFFFECLGMMSITHYGAVGNGIVDNYGPLQVAIDDANRRGLRYIYVPYGRFIYTGELQNQGDIKFMGNSKSKIVNIRTGVEIPVYQFFLLGDNYYTKTEANDKFVDIAGDTMTGPLAVGETSTATGNGTLAFGYKSDASGDWSLAGGAYSKASGSFSIAIGNYVVDDSYIGDSRGNQATGNTAIALGVNTVSSGKHSTSLGYQSEAAGDSSIATGDHTRASRWAQTVFGVANVGETGNADTHSSTTGALIVGNGSYNSESVTRSNAMKLTFGGDLYIAGTLYSNGADYAECVEWADGNPNGEDRAGKFVVLEGKKMRFANSQDSKELMGVVSAFPTVLGDSFNSYWHGKYLTDAFGRIEYQTVSLPEVRDDEGNVIQAAREQEVPVLNPDYDETLEYIPRSQRKEFGNFAMLGKLVVEDDGTCIAGEYCYPNDNGIATRKYEGFYVLERIDENHIKIFVR